MKVLKSAIAVTLAVLFLSTAASAGKVVVPEGTDVKVRFGEGVEVSSGKLQPGITLSIYLAEDVKVGGATIIEAGAEGKAKVEEIKDQLGDERIEASAAGDTFSLYLRTLPLSPQETTAINASSTK